MKMLNTDSKVKKLQSTTVQLKGDKMKGEKTKKELKSRFHVLTLPPLSLSTLSLTTMSICHFPSFLLPPPYITHHNTSSSRVRYNNSFFSSLLQFTYTHTLYITHTDTHTFFHSNQQPQLSTTSFYLTHFKVCIYSSFILQSCMFTLISLTM